MARPKLSDRERRNRRIEVRLTDSEYAEISAYAAEAGEGLGPYLRRRGLHLDAPRNRSFHEDRAHRQMLFILNNLNQLAGYEGYLKGGHLEHAIDKIQATYQRMNPDDARAPKMKVTPAIIDAIHAEGVLLNTLTRAVHRGKDIPFNEIQAVLGRVVSAVRALEGGGAKP